MEIPKLEASISGHYQLQGTRLVDSSEDTQFWWNATTPVLNALLVKLGYEGSIRNQYLDLLSKHLVRSLGARPKNGNLSQYKTTLTPDRTPFEPSWNIHGSSSLLRFSIEPVGCSAGTPDDPFNQVAATKLLQQLLSTGDVKGLDVDLFDHFTSLFFVKPGSAEHDQVKKRLTPGKHLSSAFLAFNLGRDGDATVKAYLFPTLCSIATGLSTSEIVFDAVRKLNIDLPDLRILEEYLAARPDLRVEFLAVDLISRRDARIKIYVRTMRSSLANVQDIYTLGGRCSVDAGIDTLGDLWRSVLNLNSSTPDSLEVSHSGFHTSGVLFGFELRQGAELPSPKVYLPIWHYASSDYDVATALADFLRDHGHPDVAKNYVDNVKELL